MIIIGGSSHPILAKQVADDLNCDYVLANTERFADQELKIQINRDLYEQNVIILQSTTNPANDHLMELLLLADTAKRAGCNRITAVIPYFGYGRQDRPSYEYGPISASLVARLIETSGIDKVITIDMHSKQSEGFFKIAVNNLDPTDLFLGLFQGNNRLLRELASDRKVVGDLGAQDRSVLDVHEDMSTKSTHQSPAEVEFPKKSNDYMVISPDVGGLIRARVLAAKLGVDLGIINKVRCSDGRCTMSDIIGDVKGKNCIIIDDIIDTGGTLCEAVKMLKKNGANSVKACITHGVFSRDCIDRLAQAGLSELLVTDTIYHQNLPSFITVIPTADLISNSLLRSDAD